MSDEEISELNCYCPPDRGDPPDCICNYCIVFRRGEKRGLERAAEIVKDFEGNDILVIKNREGTFDLYGSILKAVSEIGKGAWDE